MENLKEEPTSRLEAAMVAESRGFDRRADG